jgi:hypothetical protein
MAETSEQKPLPIKTDTYMHVEGKDLSMGQTLPAWGYSETDPRDLIERWIREGGLYLTNRFIPWRLINEVRWEYNWHGGYNGH